MSELDPTIRKLIAEHAGRTLDQEFEPKSKFWMNLPPVLMDTYLDLVRSRADMDTRASYLITFADTLSLTLPQSIEEYDEYKKIVAKYPLDKVDPMLKIPFGIYSSYLKIFESIMRKAGIIGGINTGKDDDKDETWDYAGDDDEC